jgi:hypothetical protein
MFTAFVIYTIVGLLCSLALTIRELDRGNDISLSVLSFVFLTVTILWPIALVLEFGDVIVFKGKK